MNTRITNETTGDALGDGFPPIRKAGAAALAARRLAADLQTTVRIHDESGDWLVYPDGKSQKISAGATYAARKGRQAALWGQPRQPLGCATIQAQDDWLAGYDAALAIVELYQSRRR